MIGTPIAALQEVSWKKDAIYSISVLGGGGAKAATFHVVDAPAGPELHTDWPKLVMWTWGIRK